MIPYVSTSEDKSAAVLQNNGKQSNTMSYITSRIWIIRNSAVRVSNLTFYGSMYI